MLPSPESEAHVTPCMTQPLLNCRICVGSSGSGKLSSELTKADRTAYGGKYLTYDADPVCFGCTKYPRLGWAIWRKTVTGPQTADRNVDQMRRKTAVRTQTARGNRNPRSGECPSTPNTRTRTKCYQLGVLLGCKPRDEVAAVQ